MSSASASAINSSANTAKVVARCTDVRKVYGTGAAETVALAGVDLSLHRGEMVALTGPSGSGKSTLLHILGTMDAPTSGRVEVLDADVSAFDDDQSSRFRNEHLGFIFQFFHLIPSQTVRENITLPARLVGRDADTAARELAERVGIGDTLERFPDELSGGQRQRVAIARALINEPALVLADEPTGNLDHVSGGEVMNLLVALGRERDVAILVATHDPAVTAAASREFTLVDGHHVAGEPG